MGPRDALRWLHFTDLHQGLNGAGHLWPAVEEQFLRDLTRLHERLGGVDLILFTGDLTQAGQAKEFHALDKILKKVIDHLNRLGSQPCLLAVPGNHDLERPLPTHPTVKQLGLWQQDPDVAKEFFRDARSPYRKVVDRAFKNYRTWWQSHAQRLPGLVDGLLPGEFAVTVPIAGLKIGVLGLNTAFLQLTSESYQGRLCIDARQFSHPCDGDGPRWVKQHDLCLLLTHHPLEWLDPHGQQCLNGEIASPGRFALHLFGHMHAANLGSVAAGVLQPWRRWQGLSLFGLETCQSGALERRHGYCAGQISVTGSRGPRRSSLRLWPRVAAQMKDGPWIIKPDHDSVGQLDSDEGTPGLDIPLQGDPPPHTALGSVRGPATRGARPPPPPPLARGLPPLAPGRPYSRDWYVAREFLQRAVSNSLQRPGTPAFLFGEQQVGKSWLIGHFLDAGRSAGQKTVGIDLHRLSYPALVAAVLRAPRTAASSRLASQESGAGLGAEELHLWDQFLYAIGLALAGELNHEPALVEAIWAHKGLTPRIKLGKVLRDLVLSSAPTGASVLLAIDGLDAIVDSPLEDALFGALRAWAEDRSDPPLQRLRLLLAASIKTAQFRKKVTESPLLNIVMSIRVGALDHAQVHDMARRYGLHASPADIAAVMQRCGGHAYTVSHLFHFAAVHRLPTLDALEIPVSLPAGRAEDFE